MILKILLLEDNIADADLIERQLKKDKVEFVSQRADTKNDFEKAIIIFKPDVILSDHSLPQFNSVEALKIAKRKLPQVPFILVTGTVSEEFAVECMKAGADDYILKSHLVRLSSSIEMSLQNHRFQEENILIKELNKEIGKKNNELYYLNQEKDRFVGIVSHDLQNYISAMSLSVGLIKTPDLAPDKHKTQVKHLDRNVTNMRTLLCDFLTINRIQHGVINALYNLVNIGNLVGDVVDRYEDALHKKGIKLIYSNKCEDMFFRTDMSYFSIIADNLISNAIKYTHSNKKIWVEIFKKGKNYILIVKDEGQGIPKEDFEKMYGRFQKLSPKPTNNEPTNGLGLSIVKDLVEALNATISCESEKGKGTTFTVIF